LLPPINTPDIVAIVMTDFMPTPHTDAFRHGWSAPYNIKEPNAARPRLNSPTDDAMTEEARMRKLEASIAIVGLCVLGSFASAAPAGAMTVPDLMIAKKSDIIQVHDHGHYHHHFHGHRGYDSYYDNYDNSGLLFKSFVTGTLFRHDQSRGYYSDSHVKACAARYRSYSAADNTYQPAGGPRQQCR
jgi:hypothetical protein